MTLAACYDAVAALPIVAVIDPTGASVAVKTYRIDATNSDGDVIGTPNTIDEGMCPCRIFPVNYGPPNMPSAAPLRLMSGGPEEVTWRVVEVFVYLPTMAGQGFGAWTSNLVDLLDQYRTFLGELTRIPGVTFIGMTANIATFSYGDTDFASIALTYDFKDLG